MGVTVKMLLPVIGFGLLLTGCTGPAEPTIAPPTPSPASTGAPAPAVTPAPTVSATPTARPSGAGTATGAPALPVLTLSGTAIGGRPLGSTPVNHLEPELVARLGKPAVGPTRLCQLTGERNRFALVDHVFGGLTVHYGRSGQTTVAIGWAVALDRVPGGFRLVDRLPWRPTFAELKAAGGTVQQDAGVRTVSVAGRAIRYTGPVGEARPDTVRGGPELTCR